MAGAERLGSAVMFVQQLDRSVAFYTSVFGLEITDRSPTAALLSSPGGSQLVLRQMGANAVHPLGGIGVQYLVWTASGPDDLERGEHALHQHGGYRETRSADGVTVVEGRDPDDVVVMLSYPGPDEKPMRELPARAYGW
jgi:catechol 2,3-dioxygenase-like lactoylglutathione lyase family enzyme